MKIALSALITATLLASSSYAAEKGEYSCTSSFGKKGPIEGYSLYVAKNDNGSYTGVLTPICRVCMVKPVYLTFDKKLGEGSMEETYTGADGTLEIALESMVPTRSHPANLVTPVLNGGQSIPFTCVAE